MLTTVKASLATIFYDADKGEATVVSSDISVLMAVNDDSYGCLTAVSASTLGVRTAS